MCMHAVQCYVWSGGCPVDEWVVFAAVVVAPLLLFRCWGLTSVPACMNNSLGRGRDWAVQTAVLTACRLSKPRPPTPYLAPCVCARAQTAAASSLSESSGAGWFERLSKSFRAPHCVSMLLVGASSCSKNAGRTCLWHAVAAERNQWCSWCFFWVGCVALCVWRAPWGSVCSKLDGYGVCRGIPAAGPDCVVPCGEGGSSGGSFTTQLDVAVGCVCVCVCQQPHGWCGALWLAGRISGCVCGAIWALKCLIL